MVFTVNSFGYPRAGRTFFTVCYYGDKVDNIVAACGIQTMPGVQLDIEVNFRVLAQFLFEQTWIFVNKCLQIEVKGDGLVPAVLVSECHKLTYLPSELIRYHSDAMQLVMTARSSGKLSNSASTCDRSGRNTTKDLSLSFNTSDLQLCSPVHFPSHLDYTKSYWSPALFSFWAIINLKKWLWVSSLMLLTQFFWSN